MTIGKPQVQTAAELSSDASVLPDGMAQISANELAPLTAELDMNDSHSVLFFGSRAQQELNRVSDSMLERVRAKDLGPAGEALNDMVFTLRGFDVSRLDHVHELEAYIAAGEHKLRQLDEQLIPEREQAVDSVGGALAAQSLRDLRAVRDELERGLHDLRLTRQVTMQSLPSIRLVQDNDKSLVGKVASALVNTVPLWRQQLAQAVTIQRGREAAATVAAATDLTKDLLRASAENLRKANRETRQQVEPGLFDIEAVSDANCTLIDAIEESLKVAAEGREARARASAELSALEQQLRQSLAAAGAREYASPVPASMRTG